MRRKLQKFEAFKMLKAAVSTLLCLAFFFTQVIYAAPSLPPARASAEQLLQMKERLTTNAERIVKGKLLSQGISSNDIAVNVDFDFDKEKLRADSLQYYQAWYQTLLQESTTARKQNMETQKSDIKELAKLLGYNDIGVEKIKPETKPEAKPTPDKKNGSDNKSPGQRLGNFNLDLLGMTYPDPEAQQQAQTQPTPAPKTASTDTQPRLPFTLGIQMSGHSGTFETPPAFTFDLADYITDVRINVILPTNAPEKLDTELRKAIAEGLGIAKQIANNADKKIIVSRAPVAKEAEKTSYIQELLKPQSALIPAVAAAAIGGILLVLAAFLLLGGISKLAAGLTELKPKEAPAAESKSETPTAITLAAGGAQGPGEGSRDEGKAGLNDPNAMSRMLAADITMVRTQIGEIIAQDPQLVAEIVRDFLSTEEGMADLKDLVTFIGFEVLKPSLNSLSKDLLNEFSAYLEDNGSERSNPMNGIELAQRLNREFVARRTKNAALGDEAIKALRKELTLADDDSLAKLFAVVDVQGCVLLLKTLSMERAQTFFKKIPTDVFREAYKILDDELANTPTIAKQVQTKLQEIQKNAGKKGSVGQKRLMLRILKSSTPDDEEFIQSLVANDDWEMKSLMMKSRFLFRDLPYVQKDIVKQAFDTFPPAFRAELCFCCNAEQQTLFLSLYPEGARAREMITAEIAQIERNDKRRSSVEKNKNTYIQQFLDVLHRTISADAKNFEEIFIKQAQAAGISPPGSENNQPPEDKNAA